MRRTRSRAGPTLPGWQPSAELAGHVRGQLADYKAPRELVLAPVQRAPNGKVDYKATRLLALQALGIGA